jgi:hypothetical protein
VLEPMLSINTVVRKSISTPKKSSQIQNSEKTSRGRHAQNFSYYPKNKGKEAFSKMCENRKYNQLEKKWVAKEDDPQG